MVVEVRYRLLVYVRIPKKFAALARIIRIRSEHGCGVRFDHAIEKELCRARCQPFVVVASPCVLNLVDLFFADGGRFHPRCDVKPHRQLLLTSQLVVGVESVKIATLNADTARTDASYQTNFVRLVHSATQCVEHFLTRRRRNGAPNDRVCGIFFNRAGRLATGIADKLSSCRVWCLSCDSGQLQRFAIRPPRVAIETFQIDGTVGNYLIENGLGRQSIVECRVLPSSPQDPRQFGMCTCICFYLLLNVWDSTRLVQVYLQQAEGSVKKMNMAIDKAWKHEMMFGVDRQR